MRLRNWIALIGACSLGLVFLACEQPQQGDGTPQDRRDAPRAESNWSPGWSQLSAGMDPVEVLTLLDEPLSVKVSRINTTWFYSQREAQGPYVVFDTRQMRVERWRAPVGR